ncbi:MAG: hypothetical protein L6422_03585 [Candidatus Marinimicrobia bacterium]|nr:hypothetical protein [Candidatus Neomarinimicrobiota bacterium]
MNVLAQILSSKVRPGTGRRELHLREIERKTGFAIGTDRQPGLEDRIIWD